MWRAISPSLDVSRRLDDAQVDEAGDQNGDDHEEEDEQQCNQVWIHSQDACLATAVDVALGV